MITFSNQDNEYDYEILPLRAVHRTPRVWRDKIHYARPAGQRRRGPSQAYRQQEKLLDRADAAFFLAHAASVTAACT